ncbi:lysine exporter protein (plasmid) [Azospirillum sp. B510]|uniref:LysE family translocator n=1 Tax=Azospirillum sp. (strain B510) TaxID=137722 RepID=UPI0001C4CC96|nr:LysE family transporter [Azospirillum sp. B510]BAI74908.1 lysine exporter protein [Azospirillum sp. B510]
MDGMIAGVVLGLSVAAPVGPMGMLCIERTLAAGFRGGFAAGLGAATVHATYAALAANKLVHLAPLTVVWSYCGRFAAAAFLLWIGWRVLWRGLEWPAVSDVGPLVPLAEGLAGPKMTAERIAGSYATAIALTFTNPVTLSFFMMLVPTMPGEAPPQAGWVDASLPLGVFLGSSLWWLTLSGAVGLARAHVTARTIARINRICGLAIVALALFIAVRPGP